MRSDVEDFVEQLECCQPRYFIQFMRRREGQQAAVASQPFLIAAGALPNNLPGRCEGCKNLSVVGEFGEVTRAARNCVVNQESTPIRRPQGVADCGDVEMFR